MPTYYFDSVGGDDANSGLSESQPRKGLSPSLATYLVSGNTIKIKCGSVYADGSGIPDLSCTSVAGLTIQEYGSGALPWLDARRSIASGDWVLHSGNIWRREWAYNAQVQRVFVGSQNIELLESSHKNGGVSGIDGSQTFWYWAMDDPSPGSCRLYMWSGSGALNPTQVWGSVKYMDAGSVVCATRILRLTDCSDVAVRNIRFSGCTNGSAIDVRGGNNFLFDGFVVDFSAIIAPSFTVQASGSSDANNVEIKNAQFLTSGVYRNWYSEAGAGVSNDPNVDPAKTAPYRNNNSNDTILLECPSNVVIRNCTIHAGYHGAITFYPQSISGRSGNINLEMTGCEIVCSQFGPYSRAFSLQRSALGGSGTVLMENNVFSGQSINAQIAGAVKATIRNNVFGPCGSSVTSLPDYWSTGVTVSKANTSRHLSFQTYSGINSYGPAASVVVENNQFQSAPAAPLAAEWYDGEPASNVIVVQNNHFANTQDPWRAEAAQRLFERRTAGSWVPVFQNNTYEGNYVAEVRLWTGTAWSNTPVNNYGGGNAPQTKLLQRPVTAPRI